MGKPKRPSTEKNRQRAAAWRKANPGKDVARVRERYRRNPALAAQKSLLWAKSNPGKRKEILAKYNRTHRQEQNEWREANSDKVRATKKRWRQANPEKVCAKTMKRLAAKKKAIPSWADHDKIAAIYLEAARLTIATGVPHEVDHIVPLQGKNVCGLHVENNLQVLTRAANLRKGSQNPFEHVAGDRLWHGTGLGVSQAFPNP
jgi:hypothetical protein